ncbi:MAG: hypothetical protein JXR77_16155 [Lentisphaeria bacterium]|nr:hypothetical protein [Lentisphaeria bacterium]
MVGMRHSGPGVGQRVWLLTWVLVCGLSAQDKRSTLKGQVFEAEEWSTPVDAWVKDQHPPDKWCLWTQEQDVARKRSGGQSLQSPHIVADRATPEEGAPPLHTHITGIVPGLYQVWMNGPARPIALSFDGRTWTRYAPAGELDLGIRRIPDGVFDLWVDDRYVNPGGLGWCYYDYLRFEEVRPPSFSHLTAFTLPDGATQLSWISDRPVPTGSVCCRTPDGREMTFTDTAVGRRNHAVVLQGLEPGAVYSAEVRVLTDGEVAFRSRPLEFRAGDRPAPGPTRAGRYRLEVREPCAVGRAAWPVTSGIPFARGELAGATDVVLRDAEGRPVPAQFEVMSVWGDGSARWLLVDFVAATRAGAATTYWLVTGPGLGTGEPLPSVARGADASWVLDTGVLRVPAGMAAADLLAGVCADGNGDGVIAAEEGVIGADGAGHAWITDAGGQRYRAAPPDLVRVETNGPIRATLRLEGTFESDTGQKLFRYRGRLSAWRGLGLLRLQWTIGNNRVSEPFTELSEAAIRLPMAGEGPLGAAIDEEGPVPVAQHGSLELLQDYDNRFVYRVGTSSQTGERSSGLLTLRRPEGTLRVMVRDFWQTYPKGLLVDARGGVLQLLPVLPPGQYSGEADRTDREQIMKYYAFRDGKYMVHRGLEWTADILVEVSSDGLPGSPSPAAHFQNPLFAQAEPETLCASGAFWNIDPWREEEFPRFHEAFRNSFANLEKGRRQRGEYGWMNYGDWWGERAWNWGNSEYDLAYVLALHFAQTGSLESLWRGDQMARHNTTIDVVHYPWTEPFRERVYAHSVGHVGGFFSPEDPRIQNRVYSMKGFIAGARDTSGGHTFQGGNFLYGFLTGDLRTLEVAREVCWNQAETYTPNWSFGIERSCGWALYNALSAYESTRNPYPLNAARIYLEKVFEKQDPETGGWRMPQGKPECDCPDAPHIGGKAFAAGVLLHGLVMFDRVEADERVRNSIVRGADWLIDVSWNESKQGFRYKTGCPKYADSGWYTTLVTDAIAYAYELTKNTKYRDFLLRTLPVPLGRTTGSGLSSGKDFAGHFRHLPHALYYVKRWGVTTLPLPPPPPIVHLRRRVFLDAAGQGSLRVIVHNPRDEGMPCALHLPHVLDGVLLRPDRLAWTAPPGISASPEMRLEVAATVGTEPAPWTLTVGEGMPQTMTVAFARPPPPGRVGTELGFLGPEDHFSLQALRACAGDVTAIEDASAADLDGYRAIVVGSDVLGSETLQFPQAAERLAGFVRAGGRLVLLQINDRDWSPGLLPLDLVAQDEDGQAGEITVPEHPLFDDIGTITGANCYDTIAYADPAWDVLARDTAGRPAILAAAYGKGEYLVLEPSFDRWAAAPPPEGGLAADRCRILLRNLRRWAMRP